MASPLTVETHAATGARRVAVADALWQSMVHPPAEVPACDGVRGVWRSRVYGPLDATCRRRVEFHRSPQPWHAMRSVLEALNGEGVSTRAGSYHGLEGGRRTQDEYAALVNGAVALPVVFVAGYPGSGTTAAQSVVRAGWADHLPELPSSEERFSLWSYPKHDPEAVIRALPAGADAFRALCLVRPFLDAAASLIVGRGGLAAFDLEEEVARWLRWSDVCACEGVTILPFSVVCESEPAQLLSDIAERIGVPPSTWISPEADYRDLMEHSGHGDVSSVEQSNLPHSERADRLARARSWLEDRLGPARVRALSRIYDDIAH